MTLTFAEIAHKVGSTSETEIEQKVVKMVREGGIISAKIDKKNKTVEFLGNSSESSFKSSNLNNANESQMEEVVNGEMLGLVRKLESQNAKIANLMNQVDVVNAKIKDSDEFLQIEAQARLAKES